VASGAAFGVALATRLGLAVAFLGIATDSLAALAGALAAVSVVWLLTRVRPATSSMVLLLAGVAMSFFFSSLILLLQYTASLGDSYQIVRWLMGGLAGVGAREVFHLLPFVTIGIAVSPGDPGSLICCRSAPTSPPAAASTSATSAR